MQVLKKKTNPWTLQQRQIIAEIVNEALTLSLDHSAIVGAITNDSEVLIVWKYRLKRYTFWFDLTWFRERVQFKKASQELAAECKKRNFAILPTFNMEEGWYIVKSVGNRYVGQIAWVDGVWMIRTFNTDWGNAGQQVHNAIFSLWMLEVGKLATVPRVADFARS
ncbi:hypothetical protein CAL7716_100100 (plasmid) [Calothrix sp. PCC 7716]|nr:hypothetical protein CAL7716_100100 [Calothrix sp. PCC 7716]